MYDAPKLLLKSLLLLGLFARKIRDTVSLTHALLIWFPVIVSDVGLRDYVSP